MMNLLYIRLAQEWKDFDIAYPLWLAHTVMDDLYYTITLVVMSLASFAVGMITGIAATIV